MKTIDELIADEAEAIEGYRLAILEDPKHKDVYIKIIGEEVEHIYMLLDLQEEE